MFCTLCGSSFDVKYCRKLHPNPVTAEYCGVCGSSDLSTPHRRPKRGMVGVVTLVVVSISVAGSTLVVIIRPLVEDDIGAHLGIVGIAALMGLAAVMWTFFEVRT